MDIKNSRRILFLGGQETGVLDIIKDLTGASPMPHLNGSTAGLTHEWDAKTAYYSAKIPIWIDEVQDSQAWKTEFLKDVAKEVVDAVGAWVFCFVKQPDGRISEEISETLKSIQEVIEQHSYGSDAVMLAVAKPMKSREGGEGTQADQEDICMQYGFEYVDYNATGTNEFGEKQGFERMKEALEANEWAVDGDDEELDLDNLDLDADDDDYNTFGREEAEMTTEIFGMKAALNERADEELDPAAEEVMTPSQQADQVDNLERTLGRLMAIREQSAGLPEEQRKRLAARVVKDIMEPTSHV